MIFSGTLRKSDDVLCVIPSSSKFSLSEIYCNPLAGMGAAPGVGVNLRNMNGETALHLAAMKGFGDAVVPMWLKNLFKFLGLMSI
jgi:hypothetical protein